jgi:uncharacterized protein (TIGR03083 family)
MAETVQQAGWDVTNFGNKDRLLQTVREEASEFFDLTSKPGHWESPTASGHWQVRDIVGHLVDVTEGYLAAFETARSGGQAADPLGLRAMANLADQNAQVFRSESQDAMLSRLTSGYEQLMTVFEGLSSDDWLGLMVPHKYMGPAPAFIFPTFQLVDYGIHSWDIREGLGLPNGLRGDVADFLAPVMFSLWQGILDTDKIGTEEVRVGIRITGRNAGLFRVVASQNGLTFEPTTDEHLDAPAVIEFDPASLVLTAYDRFHGGTAYGDRATADRFRSIFFTI